MVARVEQLPYGVGRFSIRLYLLLATLLVLVGWGIFAYSREFVEGLVVTGLRDIGTMGGATWGLYITFVVYFVGVSFAGITMAALIRLFRLDHLRPVSRMAEVLTVVALILAAFSILLDLGQPLRGIVNLFRYARPQSPFFGTFTLVVSGYLFASLIYLYLDGRRDAAVLAQQGGPLQGFYRLWAAGYRDTPAERARHERVSFWLAIAIVPLLVTAHSTLGFVFGIQSGRPGWFSTLQAPGFVVMAGVSGIGLLLVIAAIMRVALDEREQLHEGIFHWLGTLLLILILAYLYFMVVELLTTTYAGHHHEVRISLSLLTGQFAWLFWSSVASLVLAVVALLVRFLPSELRTRVPDISPRWALVPGGIVLIAGGLVTAQGIGLSALFSAPTQRLLAWLAVAAAVLSFLLLLPYLNRNPVAAAATAGILVNVAAIGKRLLIVVPSQTHGTLLPYGEGSYTPTWVEVSVVIGLFALGTLMYVLFFKVFPVMEVHAGEEGAE
jgi:molybdopterin-containing oxidoreductase family membrane subunit